MKGFFITGTDTGVGKTVVSAMLGVLLKEKGFPHVAVRKPIETGCTVFDNTLMPEDGLFLKNITDSAEDIGVITPLRFTHPLAPAAAAGLENTTIDVDEIVQSFRNIDSSTVAVVEGVGGLLVPITKTFFVSDLIKELDLPVILVCTNRLGTINHTLLSLEHMKTKGITVAGIIFNNNIITGGRDISIGTNIGLIRQLTAVPVIAALPFLDTINYNTLVDVSKTLDYGIIRSFL
ncbi:dethiobiotin synthase [Candidatus Magnetominusculus xianensis]|uniref:ATP-dependent dethiobiotin synthetase BioD n=1 Tax=Candidatus Magnetominusculus xianensis TaxID=1748249 RepID=A0ABR5SFT6_9BACT|nr:dethiobiotin synthase [Candidatus Magnetominusculus xianensis]KWT84136.1 ATP-dependent dethiobiotin synthetase BioD [Candidatus Magnetominusculus xianensis]MBF0402429.1 dethiobiotin synthase [Nitrospirota bacterium]